MKHLAILTLAALATTASAALVDPFPQSTKRKGIAPIPTKVCAILSSAGKCMAYKPPCPIGYYLSKHKYGLPGPNTLRCFAGSRVSPTGSGKLHCTVPLGNYMEVARDGSLGGGTCAFTLGGTQNDGLPHNIKLYDSNGVATGAHSAKQYCSIQMLCGTPNDNVTTTCLWQSTSAKMYTSINYATKATVGGPWQYQEKIAVDSGYPIDLFTQQGARFGTVLYKFVAPGWGNLRHEMSFQKPFVDTQDYPQYILPVKCYSYHVAGGVISNKTLKGKSTNKAFSALKVVAKLVLPVLSEV